ncbi:MAG: nucleotidyltransferase family protein [ANME-2 cluster archaeon]|nr:nucleotidyltransferase family protein [ANME-2 cluster archaeon]
MKSKQVILDKLLEEDHLLKKEYQVKTIGIFGSYARDEQTEASDVDVLVEFDSPMGFFTFIKLENYLSEKFGIKVDLVTPDALKPLIKSNILDETVYA